MNENKTQLQRTENALKNSELRYRLLFESASYGILIVDANTGDIKDSNECVSKLLGFSKEDLFKKKIWELGFSGDSSINKQAFFEWHKKDNCYYDDVIFEKKDGGNILLEFSCDVYTVNDEKEMQCVIRDVSERKRIENERLKMQKLDSLSILAAGIAHDFNNILTGIMGNTSLLLYESDQKKQRIIVDIIIRATKRAANLTKKLLMFAKGGIPEKKVCSIAEVINESVEFCLGKNSKCGCEIILSDNLWLVKIDYGQICQVIQNLLINAVQAMPNGGAIEITSSNKELFHGNSLGIQEGPYIHVSIKDEGAGIAVEHINKIFDPYFSTKNDNKNCYGLGLSAAFTIIKNHNGMITVESEEGKGSIFHIYLPAIKQIINKDEKKTEEIFAKEKKLKILFMDDEESIRNLVEKMFHILKYEVTIAGHGDEAIDLFLKAFGTENAFDLVILDLTIPGKMGGVETLKRLREIDSNVVAVISSGYTKIIPEGCSYFLSKPYAFEDLKNMLNEIKELKTK